MASVLDKLLGLGKTNQITKSKELDKFQSFGNNIVVIPQTSTYPEHLIAHGRVLSNGKPLFDIRTAINKKGNEVEFSTNMGQIPNSVLGGAIRERLGYILDGKLVACHNQGEPDKLDLVYATRKPYDWLNRQRTHQELESHAKVKDVISPVLDASSRIARPKKTLSYSQVQEIAKDIVDSNLKLQYRLSDKLITRKYLPNPKTKK